MASMVLLAPLMLAAASDAGAQDVFLGCTGTGNEPSELYRIDSLTGSATLLGAMGVRGCSALAFDVSTGILYAAAEPLDSGQSFLWQVEPATGATSPVGATGIEELITITAKISDIAFRSDGTLFAFLQPDPFLATLDVSTGRASVVGFSDIEGRSGNALSFDGAGRLLHADNADLNQLEPDTGMPTPIATLTLPDVPCPGGVVAGGRISAMDVTAEGVLYGVLNCGSGPRASPIYLVTIDPASGVITNVGTSVDGLDGLAIRKGRPGDANCDERITAPDLTAVLEVIGTGVRAPCGGDDANGDGVVDEQDLTLIIAAIFADSLDPPLQVPSPGRSS
jgi:hypothetical protein